MKRRLLLFLTAVLTALAGCTQRTFSSGDRVLVAKFLYDSHITEPKRFEVVVFKYPEGPIDKNVPKNYIKRLLGLPGEILAIFFGRLYRMPAPEPGSPPYFQDVNNKEINPNDLWKKNFMHENQSADLFDAGKFEIIRKTPEVMMAMRRIVYDNDFPAKDLKGPAWQRWLPAKESGWTPDKDNGFSHQGAFKPGADKDAVDWLRYRHILRDLDAREPVLQDQGRKPELITDFMSYNSFFVNGGWDKTPAPNWVGDLMLECNLTVTKAEGEYWMELSKGINRFQARWDLSSGICTLYKQGMDGKKEKVGAEQPTRVKAPGNYLVRFANVDARLTVWVDRELPFADGCAYPPPEVRGPGEKNLDETALQARRGPTANDLEPASVGSRGGNVAIHNVKLWRDTYYTQNANEASDIKLPAADATPDHWHAFLSDPSKWDAFKHVPVKTMYVQPGHYLCLGDNSQQSSDSRHWGLVPHRLMLGRALLVYFPFNRAGAIR
jgi:signal peptidase I